MNEALVEQVLRAVELVPPGRVASYGDIASIVGIGPRHVGNVLARWGHGVPWWRVTNSKGDLSPSLLQQAMPHWGAEGVPTKPSGTGCLIGECRAELPALAAQWQRSITDIPD
ncbi:MAG: MGMT family protein [Arachnia sp.]